MRQNESKINKQINKYTKKEREREREREKGRNNGIHALKKQKLQQWPTGLL